MQRFQAQDPFLVSNTLTKDQLKVIWNPILARPQNNLLSKPLIPFRVEPIDDSLRLFFKQACFSSIFHVITIFMYFYSSVWKLDAWCELQKCVSLQSNSNWTVSRVNWKQDALNLLCTYCQLIKEESSSLHYDWKALNKTVNKSVLLRPKCTIEMHFQKISFKCCKEPMNFLLSVSPCNKMGDHTRHTKIFWLGCCINSLWRNSCLR